MPLWSLNFAGSVIVVAKITVLKWESQHCRWPFKLEQGDGYRVDVVQRCPCTGGRARNLYAVRGYRATTRNIARRSRTDIGCQITDKGCRAFPVHSARLPFHPPGQEPLSPAGSGGKVKEAVP